MVLENKVQIEYFKLLPDGSKIFISEDSNVLSVNLINKPHRKPIIINPKSNYVYPVRRNDNQNYRIFYLLLYYLAKKIFLND